LILLRRSSFRFRIPLGIALLLFWFCLTICPRILLRSSGVLCLLWLVHFISSKWGFRKWLNLTCYRTLWIYNLNLLNNSGFFTYWLLFTWFHFDSWRFSFPRTVFLRPLRKYEYTLCLFNFLIPTVPCVLPFWPSRQIKL